MAAEAASSQAQAGPSKSAPLQQEGPARYWARDGFFLSTDKTFLDPFAVNEIFDTDLMWWNDPLDIDQMRKMLSNCMTLAIYSVPDTAAEMKSNGGLPRETSGPNCKLAGLCRVVTDYVTFAYLTDVFILEDYQRRGLASWMMRALKEVVDGWPNLRGLVLMTHDSAAARMYQRELGALGFDEGPSAGLVVLEMPGNGVKDVPEDH
ncbi:uncharacterized protein LMH87_009134 [Akanthomyces muscarius]|uniref:GNAT family N-acetyltransferase n=2 Tax=Akanthomyces TaxID=150366 RepID=A0A168EXB3_CORDF|nr:uncharacterized protein LMH87_009134 [Akanthomyces muscarius]KAJ4158616.1 hypothetical protein LMH87_009134 [Akanthomyces muscarius]OAA74356.1 GNAT family N-acetyltransferase [Akanthomyces lecanii RCEF 1005]